MRKAALLLGAVLIFVFGACAQTRFSSLPIEQGTPSVSASSSGRLFAWATPGSAAIAQPGFAGWKPQGLAGAQPIYGVRPEFNWQAYGGFTYSRFYEVPGTTIDLAGFDFSVAYFPRVRWFAAEGDVSATFGSQLGANYQFVTEMGGIRLRWPTPQGSDLWVHGLAGGAYLAPKTVYGGQHAFSYEFGAGVDLARRHSPLAYRVEADLVGTFFFGTYQYSPKVTVGLVYNF